MVLRFLVDYYCVTACKERAHSFQPVIGLEGLCDMSSAAILKIAAYATIGPRCGLGT